MANPNSSTPQCAVPSQPHGQSQSSSGFAGLSAGRREDSQFLAANEATRPFQFTGETEDEAVERHLEGTNLDPATGPGGLPKALYTELVNAATEAATLSTLRALQHGTLNLPRSTPAPRDPSSPDGNESETGDLRPFNRPPGKKRVPRPNEAKLVDHGDPRKKDYFPDPPDEGIVKAYEEHGLLGPDPSAPRVCLKQTFKGKWNKEVVDILTTKFISAVKLGTYKPVQHTWPQMTEDNSPKSDKINRMYQRRQETYYRRRKIHTLNHHRNPEAWNNVALLLDALGTLDTSDDETDNDSEHLNPDRRFKSVWRVNIGFLNPAIAQIWASVESYPTSLRPSRGNRAFKRISKAKSTSKNRMPLSGLPVNFYDPQWLKASPSRFQRGVKAEVPLPILVPHGMGCDEDDDIDMDHDRD
ncbi:hypothetical protein EDB85DRAFT_2159896 [Lactarius pseudohatsudake]|nr:hypothetical protein EDB85DRAFT_2159896 [Lactarius pseudohatsudake]